MIRISARKSELQSKNRSYRPRIGDTAGRGPKSEPNGPESAPERDFGLSTEKGLKASLNPANLSLQKPTGRHLI